MLARPPSISFCLHASPKLEISLNCVAADPSTLASNLNVNADPNEHLHVLDAEKKSGVKSSLVEI